MAFMIGIIKVCIELVRYFLANYRGISPLHD